MGSTGPRTQGPQRKADFATCPHEAETAECVEEVITSREGARRGGGVLPGKAPAVAGRMEHSAAGDGKEGSVGTDSV